MPVRGERTNGDSLPADQENLQEAIARAEPAAPAGGALFGESGDRPTIARQDIVAARSDVGELTRRAEAAGLRTLSSRHLTLFTDLPADEEVDALPEIFDLAHPQWCRYFGISVNQRPHWRMVGCLMVARERFAAAGLIPDNLPEFLHGYTVGDRFWMHEQPTEYYRRHLMLHEGTHGFMNARLGGCGPPWYMEGIAELLATHDLENVGGQWRLEMNHFPASREEMPYWGRIKIVKDGLEGGSAFGLLQIVRTNHESFLRNAAYGWSWAAAAYLDGHPDYRDRFRKLPDHVLAADFNRRMLDSFDDDRVALHEQWQVFVGYLEYGYDLERMAIDFQPGESVDAGGQATVTLAADRGWQSSGVRVEEGQNYKITAAGRYQIARDTDIWWCEPGGVTIRYYRRLPLGILVGAVRPDDWDGATTSAFLNPSPIGLETTLTPPQSGTVYLRVNDSAAELHDNAGTLDVVIRRE